MSIDDDNTDREVWAFPSYDRVGTSLSRWRLTEAQERTLYKARWVVTEKIHGANFCFVLEPDGAVQMAKRKALLEGGERFFGAERVRARLSSALVNVREEVDRRFEGVGRALVYGELFGGGYPHPGVPVVEGVQPVQTGVFYAPDVEFCAFDLALVTGDEPAARPSFVDFEVALEIFEAAGLMAAQPLCVGSMQEAMAYPERFTTTIPRRLGLPAIEDNLAEGVVLKPVVAVEAMTSKGPQRVLLKRKIDTFAEDARYHQSRRWEEPKPGVEVPALTILEWEMSRLINPNRVQSAVSKLGGLEAQSRNAICVEVVEDVLESLVEAHGEAWASISEEDRGLLRSVLEDMVSEFMNTAQEG